MRFYWKYFPRVLTVMLVFMLDQLATRLFMLSSTDSLLLFLVMMITVIFVNQQERD